METFILNCSYITYKTSRRFWKHEENITESLSLTWRIYLWPPLKAFVNSNILVNFSTIRLEIHGQDSGFVVVELDRTEVFL